MFSFINVISHDIPVHMTPFLRKYHNITSFTHFIWAAYEIPGKKPKPFIKVFTCKGRCL